MILIPIQSSGARTTGHVGFTPFVVSIFTIGKLGQPELGNLIPRLSSANTTSGIIRKNNPYKRFIILLFKILLSLHKNEQYCDTKRFPFYFIHEISFFNYFEKYSEKRTKGIRKSNKYNFFEKKNADKQRGRCIGKSWGIYPY